MVPSEIRLSGDKRSLLVVWPDRKTNRYTAEQLRHGSQSAVSKRRNLDNRAGTEVAGLTIQEVNVIGTYAVNIVFSDGYDRGIFPWKFLQALNTRPAAVDLQTGLQKPEARADKEKTMEV